MSDADSSALVNSRRRTPFSISVIANSSIEHTVFLQSGPDIVPAQKTLMIAYARGNQDVRLLAHCTFVNDNFASLIVDGFRVSDFNRNGSFNPEEDNMGKGSYFSSSLKVFAQFRGLNKKLSLWLVDLRSPFTGHILNATHSDVKWPRPPGVKGTTADLMLNGVIAREFHLDHNRH
jgi:hypothetical protein